MRVVAVLSTLVLAVSTAHAASKSSTPVVPNQTQIAVYVPPGFLTASTYSMVTKGWIEPGKAMSDALRDVGGRHFPTMQVIPAKQDAPYGLLLDLEPDWSKGDNGRLELTMEYDVYDAAGKKLHSGNFALPFQMRGNINAAAYQTSSVAIQKVMSEVRAKLQPDPTKFPAIGSTLKIDTAALVNHDKPLRTGTAFFINKGGQLLTAAHVARECVLLEAHVDGATFPLVSKASSDLLDVAVLDSGRPRPAAMPLRQGNEVILGEAVTSVGFPLHGLLGDSPNVTRGNVSASKGLRGSMGMFQFSAPIQPGNSGGPIVSDNGELLGMAVSTLNAEALAKQGQIPQNVNFALDARHVARFLERENVPFDVVKPQGPGSLQAATQAALSNTVQLNCYQ